MSGRKRQSRSEVGIQAMLFDLGSRKTVRESILDILQDISRKWTRHSPASDDAIESLIQQTGLDFPEDYLTFLRYSNGGEGSLAVQPGWFHLLPVEEALESNKRLMIGTYLPGYFKIGTNGGGEMLVFGTREKQPWKVYYVPAIGMEVDTIRLCAKSFRAFVKAIGR